MKCTIAKSVIEELNQGKYNSQEGINIGNVSYDKVILIYFCVISAYI